jgi:RND family efflux transporter MFP subunit
MQKVTSIQKLLLFLLVVLTACGSDKNEASTELKKRVKIFKIEEKGSNKLVFNGTTKEKSTVLLSFRVGGQLTNLNIDKGDYVRKGQIIATLDKSDYEIKLQTTKAQYDQLRREYNRYKELFVAGKYPANNMDKIESEYLTAKASYENAINQLSYTELRAPFSGHIDKLETENHQTISPGQPVASIVDLSEMEVVTYVSEGQVNQIHEESESYLKIDNAGISHFPIHLKSIDRKKGENGLYEVRFSVKSTKEATVLPGMSAEVTMLFHSSEGSILIPPSAMFSDENKNCVWLYSGSEGKVTKKTVEIAGFSSGGKIKVLSGISLGDTIVDAGVHSLSEGQSVEVIKEPSKTNIGGLL